jgi:hypothetical protein
VGIAEAMNDVSGLAKNFTDSPVLNGDDASEDLLEDDVLAHETGIPAVDLAEDDLMRELEQLHRTRHETFLHASTQALQRHSERTVELELEYLRRHPERDIDENRLRDGHAGGPDVAQSPE